MTDQERFAAVVRKLQEWKDNEFGVFKVAAQAVAIEVLPDITAMHEAWKAAEKSRDEFQRQKVVAVHIANENAKACDVARRERDDAKEQLAAKDAEIERLKAELHKTLKLHCSCGCDECALRYQELNDELINKEVI